MLKTRCLHASSCFLMMLCAPLDRFQDTPGQLLFISDRGGSWDVYSVDTNGDNIRQLTRDFGMNADGSDLRRIADDHFFTAGGGWRPTR